VRMRKTIEALKRTFSNSLAKQKSKYERELVALLPSLEPDAVAAGLSTHAARGDDGGGDGDADADGAPSRSRVTWDPAIGTTHLPCWDVCEG